MSDMSSTKELKPCCLAAEQAARAEGRREALEEVVALVGVWPRKLDGREALKSKIRSMIEKEEGDGE